MMRAMTSAQRFKTREAQTPVPGAAAIGEVTQVEATPVGATPEEAILGVVILEGVVVDLMEDAVTADGTRRMTKSWRT